MCAAGGAAAQTEAGAPAGEVAAAIPPDQLDSLVAPIALYPDELLAQVLVASTYPLELVQLHQWLQKNPTLKDEALVEAVGKQPWDPSVQSMAAFPDVVKWLVEDVQWTTELGNAFLAQQSDVMDAVQRMRKKAQDKGALASNEQQTVETQVVEDKTVIVVQSADPEVIYVPSYSPTVVYGPPVYPYPPIYYPPYPAGAMFMSFSFGVMMGAAWGGSCCGCGWGSNDVKIKVDNNFNRNTNIDRGGGRGDGNWQHNPKHRGGTPYGDRATASKYGGSARGDSLSSRQSGARQQIARQQGAGGASSRAGAASRPSAPRAGAADRPSGSRASASSRPAGGSDRVGNRNIPKSSGSRMGGFGGGDRGYSGASARASSSRGSRSMGGMGGARGGGGGARRR